MALFRGLLRLFPFSQRFRQAALLALSFGVSFSASAHTVLHDHTYSNRAHGLRPVAGLAIDEAGNLYGVASRFGDLGRDGVVFTMKTNGSEFVSLHQFFGGVGDSIPLRDLVPDGSGRFYGTTARGACGGEVCGSGIVFGWNQDGSSYTGLRSFWAGEYFSSIGNGPSVILDGSGNLYGTTYNDTGSALGTVFTMKTDGTGYQILHAFSGGPADGSHPDARLLLDDSGVLYGTTVAGGSSDLGTVFRLRTDGSEFGVLHSFAGGSADGSAPSAGLIQDPVGRLYGTTRAGGPADLGTVYALGKDGTDFTLVHSFAGFPSDGAKPCSSLLLDPAGNLYGTTREGGTAGFGTVFALRRDGSSLSVLHHFSGTGGSHPESFLVMDGAGTLYGTASEGGPDNAGLEFSLPSLIGPTATAFYTFHPCRLVDTREPEGPLEGPSISPGVRRFVLAGACGVPADARSLAVNITTVNPGSNGDLRIYPNAGAAPAATTIHFAIGGVRANNAIVSLAQDGSGSIDVLAEISDGVTLDLLVDVVGFFR
ncbi:hypothetical protein PLCT1_02568 [Planctomycetaceae bacterium]|nr:hypothetical protein PLCT1_02568 [Planctomycetaceae bacterium]